MSARRALYVELMSKGPHSPDRSERASELIDDFVRELVEEGRKFMGPRSMGIDEPERVARYVAGWHDALDYITRNDNEE